MQWAILSAVVVGIIFNPVMVAQNIAVRGSRCLADSALVTMRYSEVNY